ncbi:hypothetical protein B0H17DRAFT_1098506, partial [Mycena rosella]
MRLGCYGTLRIFLFASGKDGGVCLRPLMADLGSPIDDTIMSSTASLLPDSSTQASTPPRRTLEDVRDQVAFELAIRAISTAETLDGVRFGVILTLPKSDDESFLQRIAAVLGHNLLLSPHLFALASPAHLLLTGSPPAHVQRALLLATAALPARIPRRTEAASQRRCAISRPRTSRSCGGRCGRASRATSACRRRARRARRRCLRTGSLIIDRN